MCRGYTFSDIVFLPQLNEDVTKTLSSVISGRGAVEVSPPVAFNAFAAGDRS